MHPLPHPITANNVDGTKNNNGNITHYAILTLRIGTHICPMQLLITKLGREDFILGLPWFKKANPQIDWTTGMITINKITMATRLAQPKAPKEERPLHEIIPKEYHEFLSIFDEQKSQRLPPSRAYDHAINLKDRFIPRNFKPYPLSLPQQEKLDIFIDENLKHGYIRPSQSPMASPFFFVAKKDGLLRPCQDYRYLNNGTIKNAYPLPLIQDLLDKLHGSQFFTKLDIRWGYNNIRIKDGDQWKAAFTTPRGLFEPTVMFFGLCNSPATFQNFMNDIFRDEILKNHLLVYMDDILIHSRELSILIDRTLIALRILKKHDLYLKPSKCIFNVQRLEYLGLILSPDHIETDPAKIKGIADWPIPKNLRELRSFTGFTNFYRRFIPHYAEVTKPLDELKRKDVPFVWSPKCNHAFDSIKQKFLLKPILLMPNPHKPFILETDASKVATGAVLHQHDDDGFLKACGYLSQSFNPAERNYEIYDRELLAIIRGLTTWRHYLLGSPHPVTVWCDHQNLTYWREPRRLSPRQARWHLFLSQFDLHITHVPGKDLIQSDLLSRRADHVKQGEEDLNEVSIVLPDNLFLSALSLDDTDKLTKHIISVTTNDPRVHDLLSKIKKNIPPTRTVLSDWNETDGIIYFKTKIYIPDDDDLKKEILRLHHDIPIRAHPGIFNTYEQIRRTYYWPGMQKYVSDYVHGCAICQQMKINTHPTVPPYLPIAALPDALPFATVNMDFITDLPLSQEHDTLLVVVDHDLTKAIVLIPCDKTVDALTTAQLYFDNVYRRFGLPNRIISDRGPQFASRTFQELCKLTGIKSRMSTAYHPQTDGQAERTNQEIEAYLRIYCASHPENWTRHIPIIEFAHNNRVHSVTKRTPFELLMGYEPTTLPVHTPQSNIPSVAQRLALLTANRQEALAAHELARHFITERLTKDFQPFKLGDKVWLEARNLRTPGRPSKFKPKREGPFTIKEVLSPLAYRLKLPSQWRIHSVFHASLLTPYRTTDAHGPPFSQPPPDLIEGEQEFEVEAILAHRGTASRRQYLVKWLGYPTSDNSWEPPSNLSNSKEILDEYKATHGLN